MTWCRCGTPSATVATSPRSPPRSRRAGSRTACGRWSCRCSSSRRCSSPRPGRAGRSPRRRALRRSPCTDRAGSPTASGDGSRCSSARRRPRCWGCSSSTPARTRCWSSCSACTGSAPRSRRPRRRRASATRSDAAADRPWPATRWPVTSDRSPGRSPPVRCSTRGRPSVRWASVRGSSSSLPSVRSRCRGRVRLSSGLVEAAQRVHGDGHVAVDVRSRRTGSTG